MSNMTREEAIGRIKARFDKWALDDEDTKAIQTLIPELRESESEDERVRKALIDLVCTVGEYYLPKLEARNKMLDYLEKQKEQKPCWNPTEEDVALFNKAITTNASLSPQERAKLDIIRMKFKHRPVIEQKEQKPVDYDHEMWKNCEANFEGGKKEVIDHPEKYGLQKPAEWSEEDEKKLERVDDLLWMLDDYISNDCSICEERTARLRDEIHNELFPWLEFLRPQYHGDVTMTEAYKMGLEAGKASSRKPNEKQTNNVIVELTRIELGDIINGLYYLKEKYYEDCKEHNGTATVGLSDEFKFYFKRFNEVLDLYTRLHELEKQTYETATTVKYYE